MTDFDDIVSGLELEPDTDNVRPVTDYGDGELMIEFSKVKRALLAAGDMLSNKPCETTAELLSLRAALSVEMRRRNLT